MSESTCVCGDVDVVVVVYFNPASKVDMNLYMRQQRTKHFQFTHSRRMFRFIDFDSTTTTVNIKIAKRVNPTHTLARSKDKIKKKNGKSKLFSPSEFMYRVRPMLSSDT